MSTLAEVVPLLSSIVISSLNVMVLLAFLTRHRRKVLKRTPKVSVIVAAWNEGPRIERCVRSLVEMDYPKSRREIIVVGGGTDDTSSICKRLAKSGTIKFLEEKTRSGKWFALNRAVDVARYDYVAFTDADGIVPGNWLRTMSSYDKVDIVVSPAVALHDKGHVGKCFFIASAYLGLIAYGLSRIFRVSAFSGVGSFMRKSIVKSVRFEKSYVEDYKFCQKAISAGYNLKIAMDAPVFQGQPESFSDWKKCYLRIYHGLLSEMIFLKDGASILFLCIGALTLIGGVFSIFTGPVFFTSFIVVNSVLFVTSMVNIFIISKINGSTKYFLRFPYLFIFYTWAQLVAVESFFRWVVRRDIGWPIYNKS